MSTTNDIAKVMTGRMNMDQAEARLAVETSARQLIFCPYTQKVLDVATTVVAEITRVHGAGGPHVMGMHADHWDTVKDNVLGTFGSRVTVHDGRELFAKVAKK